jgi:transcriptional regulator with XRE-family HTH domain
MAKQAPKEVREQNLHKRIGRVIAKKRKAADMTQEQVAEHLEIGAEAFSRIERGLVSPGLFKLYELAALFNCKIEDLLTEGSRMEPDQTSYVNQMLGGMTQADRQLIVSIVEKLSGHLSKKRNKGSEDWLV